MPSSFFQRKLAFRAFLGTKLLLLSIAIPLSGQESGKFRPNSSRANSNTLGRTFSLVAFDDTQVGSESLPPKKNNVTEPKISNTDERPEGSSLGSVLLDQSPSMRGSPYVEVNSENFEGDSVGLGQQAYHQEILGFGFDSLFDPARFEVLLGAQSFQGPLSFPRAGGVSGGGGRFGIHQGVQWTGPVPWVLCGWLHGQVGFRATQNQWNGSPHFDGRHDQTFFTTGLFRRVDFGLQGGVVFDLLREDTYFQTQLTQLRGNLSFAFLNQSEIGFEWARHLDSQVEREWIRGATATTALESEIVATDTNRFYWSTLLPAQPRIRTDVGLGFASGHRFLVDGSLTMPLRESQDSGPI